MKRTLYIALAIAFFMEVIALTGCERGYVPLTEVEIQNIQSGELNAKKRILIDSALSLVGEVGYFWGGKSDAVGQDPRWGELRRVESEGSETTGSVMPYGLDCSGYVAWCYWQIGVAQEDVGTVTYDQFDKARHIDWSEIAPGDLVFKNTSAIRDNHVGICVGYLDGEPVFAHCSLSLGGVVVTGAGGVFRYARRPKAADEI